MDTMLTLQKNLMTIGAFENGRYFDTKNDGWKASTSMMQAKCLRIYNRGLTTTEVQNNYDKTVSYHNLMESLQKKPV